jgi:hypothetical protein
MMPTKFGAAAALGLTAAACSYSETTMRAPPPPVAVAPVATTYVAPAPVATTVYAPAPAPVTVVPAAPTPPAGVQAFRDEYGFRYDGQGNRLDRYGNIISPQSTTP